MEDNSQSSSEELDPVKAKCLVIGCGWFVEIPVPEEEARALLIQVGKAETLKHAAYQHGELFRAITKKDPMVAVQEYQAELRSMGIEIEGDSN